MMGFGGGSGIICTVCKQAAPCSRVHTDNHTNTSSLNFYRSVLFLTPNQLCQSTEGLRLYCVSHIKPCDDPTIMCAVCEYFQNILIKYFGKN